MILLQKIQKIQQTLNGLLLAFIFFQLLNAQAILAEENKPLLLTLNQAVEIGLKNNLQLYLQKEDVTSAQGLIETSKGAFDTLFTANAGLGENNHSAVLSGEEATDETRTISSGLSKKLALGTELSLLLDSNRTASDPTSYQIDPAYTSSLNLTISQPLLKGRGSEVQTATVEAAEKQLQMTYFLVQSEAADLAATVKNSYWELVYSLQEIEVRRLSLTLAERLLNETKIKIEAGRLAPVEIFQPESEVARREQLLITGERAIGFAEDNLKILLNFKNWERPIKPLDLPVITNESVNLETVMKNALLNRPDLQAAMVRIDAAKIIAKQKENYTLPQLSLYGRAGIGGSGESYSDSFSNINDENDDNWQLGVNFSYALENNYARGEHQQALSSIRRSKIQAEQLRQEIRRKVRSTVRDVKLAGKAIVATRKTTLATTKRLEAEQTKFEAGKATAYDVLVAQESYSQTLAAEYRAKVIYVQVLAEMDRVQGFISLEKEP